MAAETYGSLLASVLMNKLPNDLRLIIGRKIGELDWQLDTIMTELLQEVEARERANPPQPEEGKWKDTTNSCHSVFGR